MSARLVTVCALAALAPGCTFSDGVPFATLEAHLAASAPIPADRATGDAGWQRLASDFEVELDALELEAAAVELVDVGVGGVGFDPANPPDGYSLCHNGHCHSDAGGLVDYEDIAAELAGAGELDSVAVSLPLGALDVLAGVEVELGCEPSCDFVAPASIGLVRIELERLSISGRVRDGLEAPRLPGQRDFSLEIDAAGFAWITPVALPIDRRADPDVELDLALELVSVYLDGVDFAGDLTAQSDAIIAGLAELELEVAVFRGGVLVSSDHGDEDDHIDAR